MAKLVGSRYASALFEVGLESEKINLFHDELIFLVGVFNSEPKLMDIFNHPKVTDKEKKELIDNIFGERISAEMKNFLYVLVDKNRETDIFDIANSYEEMYNDHENILNIVAITSIPMDDSRLEKLKLSLEAKFEKNIVIKNEIDKNILGGVVLKIGDKLIDGSIKAELDSIRQALKSATV